MIFQKMKLNQLWRCCKFLDNLINLNPYSLWCLSREWDKSLVWLLSRWNLRLSVEMLLLWDAYRGLDGSRNIFWFRTRWVGLLKFSISFFKKLSTLMMFLSDVFKMLFLTFMLPRQYSSWSKITSINVSFYGFLFYLKDSFELNFSADFLFTVSINIFSASWSILYFTCSSIWAITLSLN